MIEILCVVLLAVICIGVAVEFLFSKSASEVEDMILRDALGKLHYEELYGVGSWDRGKNV